MDGTGESADGGNADVDARPRYQPLVIVLLAVVAGIVLDRYGGPTFFSQADRAIPGGVWFAVWWYLALCLLCAWWFVWRQRRDAIAAWLLVAAAALTGAAWHDARWQLFPQWEIARYAGYDAGPTCLAAVARESPERLPASPPTPLRAIPSGERSRLLVDVLAVRDGIAWRPADGDCEIVTEGHLLGVRAGDRVKVFGQLSRPVPPRNPGEFDFAAHARADRHLARLRSSAPESVVVAERAGRWNWRRGLDAVRAHSLSVLRRYVGPERAGLAGAILLGAREGLPREETTAYLATGTVHLLVVSGLNVGILAAGLWAAMRLGWLSRRAGLILIMVAVVVYTLLTRSEPPVLRAAVLAVLLCVAAWTGRRGVAFNSLAAAGLIVLAINPADLFRSGPQLSFLCVAALVWVGSATYRWQKAPADRLDQMLQAVRPWHARLSSHVGKWALWLIVTTIVVWLTALPLVLYQFHVLSPVAIPISPPVWLVVFVAMWSGFLLLLFGWMWAPLATVLGAVCNYSLAGLEWVVKLAEAVPTGHSWWPGPGWWWVAGFYVGLVAVMIWGRALAAPRWQVAALAAWILVGLAPPLVRSFTRDQVDVAFLSVGHGTCVLIEGPRGETLLYDAGSLGTPDYATQTIASYLWHRGIRRIDGIVLSHADIDHYNAVPGLLERFRVGTIYVSPVMFSRFGPDAASLGPSVLRDAIDRAGVPLREIWSGDRLRVGADVAIEVLHPPRRGVVGSDNANSITLAVECGGRRLLLPGDLESPGIEDLTSELPYRCDVLLAPHHGSRRSDPPGFAAWCTPRWVVISGGRDDEVVPVVQTYARTGARVFHTHELGTVQFTLETGSLELATWLNAVPLRSNSNR